MLAVFILYIIVLDVIGYIISTALLIVALLWLFGCRNKVMYPVLAVAFPFLLFFVFQVLLRIQLPKIQLF